jgi:hypothetical protein
MGPIASGTLVFRLCQREAVLVITHQGGVPLSSSASLWAIMEPAHVGRSEERQRFLFKGASRIPLMRTSI